MAHSVTGKILDVTWSGEVGGIERLLEALARTTAGGDGYAHQVLFLDGSGSIGDGLVEEKLAKRLGMRRGYDVRGLARLARELRRLRPRILHFHTDALGAHVVSLVALPGATRVYTEHSRRAITGDLKFRLLYSVLRRTTAAFVGISASMGDALVRMGIDPDRVVVIPNGCPVPRRTGHRDPEHDRDPARGPTIGVVGRLEPHKRVDLFLDVLSELRRRGVKCAGLVVGDGSLRDELIHHRNALGLGDAVEVVGNQHDVVPWLDRLQVFMVTSEIEPFGIAALEAMARGVPVVGMPCPGGLAELLEGGGLLLPDREIATAADALQTVLASATEQSRLRSRGDAAVEEFSLARTVDRLDELYASLIRPTPESDVGPAPRAVRLRSAVRRSASRRSRRG